MYGSVYNIGMICRRCSLLSMVGGPGMAMMPHCPPVPDDADPEVIALEEDAMGPLTLEELNHWVVHSGNPYKPPTTGGSSSRGNKVKVKDLFTENKIREWFDGRSVRCRSMTPDLIHFELFVACAAKHPPSSADIPGIDTDSATQNTNPCDGQDDDLQAAALNNFRRDHQ